MSEKKRVSEPVALAVTRWVGSSPSLVFHTLLFAGSFFAAYLGLIPFERMLLVVTTIVSLEAIYLSIFIQMSLNIANQTIEAVEEDLDEIQEDIDEIQKDVDEIQKDVDGIEENEEEDEAHKRVQKDTLISIEKGLAQLLADVERLKSK